MFGVGKCLTRVMLCCYGHIVGHETPPSFEFYIYIYILEEVCTCAWNQPVQGPWVFLNSAVAVPER